MERDLFPVGGRDFRFAPHQAHLAGADQLHEASGAENDAALFLQPELDGVGAARIGPQPVARIQEHPGRYRCPPLLQARLQGTDPLRINDLSKSSNLE